MGLFSELIKPFSMQRLKTDPQKKQNAAPYDVMQEPLVFSKALFDKILSMPNPGDLFALYAFYYYTAKWQHTNRPKATNQYVINKLNWSEPKLLKTKKQLIELGLIEQVRSVDENNRITGNYVKVNFIWCTETIDSRNLDFPYYGEPRTTANLGTNALSSNNKNALSNDKENASPPTPQRGEKEEDDNESFKSNEKGDESIETESDSSEQQLQLIPTVNMNQFETFWKAYPNHIGSKGKALDAWRKLCNKKKADKPTIDVILKAIQQQKRSTLWVEGYIPHASTWINQTRWIDDPIKMKSFVKARRVENTVETEIERTLPDWVGKL